MVAQVNEFIQYSTITQEILPALVNRTFQEGVPCVSGGNRAPQLIKGLWDPNIYKNVGVSFRHLPTRKVSPSELGGKAA